MLQWHLSYTLGDVLIHLTQSGFETTSGCQRNHGRKRDVGNEQGRSSSVNVAVLFGQ
ncbi:hypothetical protein BDZ89DRAFT_1062432 [Hymenopellis radicata]|nr:hypothetical protein BDZ89DRAFT_1062432 [Hymenopellis radicata]